MVIVMSHVVCSYVHLFCGYVTYDHTLISYRYLSLHKYNVHNIFYIYIIGYYQ